MRPASEHAQIPGVSLEEQQRQNPDTGADAHRYAEAAQTFRQHFEQSGDVKALDKVISSYREALKLASDNHSETSEWLNNLGESLISRFERLGDIEDTKSAVAVLQRAVDLTPDNHIDKPPRLNNLGNALSRRFQRLGTLEDIDDAITSLQRAVDLTPDDHANEPLLLNNLGGALAKRFKRSGRLDDIDNAIAIQQRGVDLTPNAHASKPTRLNNLGNSLTCRFEHLGELVDIEHAISNLNQAVELASNDDALKPSCLNNLGNSYACRFERLGSLEDINKAIAAHKKAVDLTPDDHPDKFSRLSNLGGALGYLFGRLGELKDIDSAIVAQQKAIDLMTDTHADKPVLLNNLGSSFTRRFKRLGDVNDINNAIAVQRRALELTPAGHADRSSRYSNLATLLIARFEHHQDLKDIDDAIDAQQQAVNLTTEGHTDRPGWLNNLGSAYVYRFQHLSQLQDIEKAISVQRQAVDLIPNGHFDKPRQLSNLGHSLTLRFQLIEDSGGSIELEDVNNAIVALQQAVDLTPKDNAERAKRLNNLGRSFLVRYGCLEEMQDIENASACFSASATSITGSPADQFQAARNWAILANPALEPHQVVIDLIPRVAWLGRTVQQRYEDITSIGDAAMEAATAACQAGDYDLALEWLEQGRSIVWGQILQLRSPMDDFRIKDPGLTSKLGQVAIALETVGNASNGDPKNALNPSLEESAQAHRRLAEKWESLLEQVRSVPGFADFLRPKKASVLKAAARFGTIVIVNVSELGCDALVLKQDTTSVGYVQLPNLAQQKLEAAQRSLLKSLHNSGVRARGIEQMSQAGKSVTSDVLIRILSMLWSDVAEPILHYLGYMSSPQTPLPHIKWCLTGSLASLPLHAAGLYSDPQSKLRLFNYVVSSYTPSLTALLESSPSPQTSDNLHSVLAITQAATPNLTPLPGTVKEIDEVERQLRSADRQFTRLDGSQATVMAVSEAMDTHSWVHFSCHGKQDALEPTKSAFHLDDGTLELGEIMKKPLKHAELAYLSACQTASGDAKVPDEAVHLAAGMFIAGYQSVVATLWSIRDDDAPLVARVFYEQLIENRDAGAARALHEAVRVLREKAGEENFTRWAPFIHVGH